MKPQEIFDTVVRHLFTQGKRAMRVNVAGCAYRGAEGTKCAVGALLPDENYNSEMEGMGVEELMFNFGDKVPRYFHNNKDLLSDLQKAHDLSSESMSSEQFNLEKLSAFLSKIAHDYNLNTEVAKEFA